jgi:hypothetical protein
VPWCDTCDRFYNPNTLVADGTCPTCGRTVGADSSGEVAAGAAGAGEVRGAPWHFWALITATAVYLGYRLLQGVIWVAQRL